MTIKWDQCLEAMYGHHVGEKQIAVWEHYLKAEKTNSGELVRAIEMAANEGIKAEEWRVTVRDLRKWLKIYRKREAANASSQGGKDRIAAFVSEWREKLDRGAEEDDCILSTVSLCKELGLDICEENGITRRIFAKEG